MLTTRSLLKNTIGVAVLLLLPLNGQAESLRISQIDASQMILNQWVRLFVSVTDENRSALKDLTENHFSIMEMTPPLKFQPVSAISEFRVGANYEEGVQYLLMLDNSGSMYWTIKGNKTLIPEKQRIFEAKAVIRSLLADMTNPRDRVGLVVYNSFYRRLATISDRMDIVAEKLINAIEKPEKDAWHTEIYSSLVLAADEFTTLRGRKATIILSDGVNDPYFNRTGKMHPVFGDRTISPAESIQALQKAGVSVHVIHFGKTSKDKDIGLINIAEETGGNFFHAESREGLQTAYNQIFDQIANEYVITYKAPMTPSEKKRVRVEFQKGHAVAFGERLYHSAMVFGSPLDRFHLWLPIPLIAAILLLWGLTRFRFEKPKPLPTLEVLGKQRCKTPSPVLALSEIKPTVIGASKQAAIVLHGLAEVRDRHAEIVFNSRSKRYSIKPAGDLMVNNQRVTQKKVLKPGDLIKIDEAIIVFDEGQEMDKSRPLTE